MATNEYFSNWLKAVIRYANETKTTILDLSGIEPDRRLEKEEVKFVLNLLPHSQITDLSLHFNFEENFMAELAPLLIKTKIRKLFLNCVSLSDDDMVQLGEVLPNSQITNLAIDTSIEPIPSFTVGNARRFISNLQKSKLTTFDQLIHSFPEKKTLSLVQRLLLTTSMTSVHLPMWLFKHRSNDLIRIFSMLPLSSVTDFHLDCEPPYHPFKLTRLSPLSPLSDEAWQELSQRLVESKIQRLIIDSMCLDDDGQLSILIEGLINSNVIDLEFNGLRSDSTINFRPLFNKLKETKIKTLTVNRNRQLKNESLFPPDCFRLSCLISINLRDCYLNDKQGEELMESLRFSRVTELNLTNNRVGLLTVKKLAENINDFNLVNLNISCNKIPLEGLFILGQSFKKSKFRSIDVSNASETTYLDKRFKNSELFAFLKLTEGSSITQIKMRHYSYSWYTPLDCESSMLVNTSLTELHLSSCYIGDKVLLELISCLKSTITHLNLAYSKIGTHGAIVLAGCLKDMQIRRLNLSYSSIGIEGVKALALSLKNSNILYLGLCWTEDEGIEFLAEHAKDTFITELNVNSGGPPEKELLLDKVLLENKITVHKLVTVFRKIAPKTDNGEFCFDQNSYDLDVSAFLKRCMWFYKTVINNPRAINVFLEEEDVSLSRDQIFRLIFEEFPRQFSRFVACSIEAAVTEHVKILKKADTMGLPAIVESLLLHRPVYVLDEEQDILHPTVYTLMLKYKQPVCNLDVEPFGVEKIISYFRNNTDVEGAEELISLLFCPSSS